MKLLIAPDKFKDALDAADVAAALAAGAREAQPSAEVVLCPLGDGGEGTGRVLSRALGAAERRAAVLDPLGRERSARWWLCPDARTALIEMAEASGLALLSPAERDPLRTTSFGTGQLLRAASHAGCTAALLCVGGSATTDGGAGCLQALGWRCLNEHGHAITTPLSGAALREVRALKPPTPPSTLRVLILCDVNNPLLGALGAAAVFGPQKGATPDAVRELERGLLHWANLLESVAKRPVRDLPGAGAAGGLPAGLCALLDADLRPGFDIVAQHVGLRDKLAASDLCLTGEGRIDLQTTAGKVVAGVARLARACGVRTIAFAGDATAPVGQTIADLAALVGVDRIVPITPAGMPLRDALALTAVHLRRCARDALCTDQGAPHA